jgi:hypothetical protein
MGGRVATRLQLLLKADECSGSDDGEVLQRGRYWNESSKSGYLKHENNFQLQLCMERFAEMDETANYGNETKDRAIRQGFRTAVVQRLVATVVHD